jgi:hypothetical protein
MNALVERTAQLRRVELVAPRSVIGKNTVESLQAGAIWGFAGQVDGIVRRMVAELGRHGHRWSPPAAWPGPCWRPARPSSATSPGSPSTACGSSGTGTGGGSGRPGTVALETMAERLPRPDRVEGRALSPRAFRPSASRPWSSAPPATQEGLVPARGRGRLAAHGRARAGVRPAGPPRPRSTRTAAAGAGGGGRHPGQGPGHARPRDGGARRQGPGRWPSTPPGRLAAAGRRGPGETWLYLAEEEHPAAVLEGFLGPPRPHRLRPRQRRSGLGSLASLGLLWRLFLVIYGSAAGLGPPASSPAAE